MSFFQKAYYKFFRKKEYQIFKQKKKIEISKKIYETKIKDKIKNFQEKILNKKKLNFLHSGHCGDLICSLPVIKELSKRHECSLLININKKMPLPYYKHPAGKVYIDDRTYELIKPLLANQSYISKVEKYDSSQSIDIDLDLFREMPINISFNATRWYFHITGVHANLYDPYMEVEQHEYLKNKIIIHRTFRYRNQFINYNFLNNFDDIYFIGIKEEYLDLKKSIENLNFYECKDYLDMAKVIKSSKIFIGNSSVAFPIAEALKVPRILEASPDLPVLQPIGSDGYDFYFQIHFEKIFNYLYNKN